MSSSPRIPLVLGYRHGRYVDVTRQYPDRLRAAQASTIVELHAALDEAGNKSLQGDGFAPVVQYYAVSLLLADRRRALQDIYRHLRQIDRPEFRRRQQTIETIIRERELRYDYPRPYRPMDMNAVFMERARSRPRW